MRLALIRVILALVTFTGAGQSLAQTYPTKPIRFLIGFPPGSVLDAVARPIAAEMSKRLGQPIVIEFKPGANATIAAKEVAGAPPDGYLLLVSSAINHHPIFNLNNAVDAAKELAPVSQLSTTPYFLFSTGGLPVKSLQELGAYSKANPGRLRYATAAPNIDLAMLMLKVRTGIESEGIPYKGGAAMGTAVLAGEVDLALLPAVVMLGQVRAGKVNALFTMSEKRSVALPGVPTSSEAGVADFQIGVNTGLWAPVGTPREIIQKLGAEVALAIRVPAVLETIQRDFGSEAVGSSSEQQLRSFETEIKFWAEAARLGNFRPQ